MKANHNLINVLEDKIRVVVNISKSKNESKSQQGLYSLLSLFVVVNISKSNLPTQPQALERQAGNESKSQHDS